MEGHAAPNKEKKSAGKLSIRGVAAITALIAAITALIVALSPIFKDNDQDNKKAFPPEESPVVLLDGKLGSGLDMGVDSKKGNTGWASLSGNELCMSYPGIEEWGAVFITVGKPTNPPRPAKNYSNYNKLLVELKGERGDESILIGMKDNEDSDDGSGSRVRLSLTSDWAEYRIDLSQFKTADLKRVYTVTEFVFESSPQKICVRKILFAQ